MRSRNRGLAAVGEERVDRCCCWIGGAGVVGVEVHR